MELYTPNKPFGIGWSSDGVSDQGYNLYVKDSAGSCPSTSSYNCKQTVYRYYDNTKTCDVSDASAGTYYSYVTYQNWGYVSPGPAIYYQVTATLSNCTSEEASNKIAFISSKLYDGNLGGLNGADQECDNMASLASLSGTFKAWLSTSDKSPNTRFTKNSGYEDVNGNIIADSWSTLTDGDLDYDLKIDENGIKRLKGVWTGTKADGTYYGSDTCLNWLSGSSSQHGRRGYSGYSSDNWTDYKSSDCNDDRRIYCFEQ